MEIYKITNIVTGKIYVGFSINSINRFKRHCALAEKGINRRLYDSIRKHGRDNFVLSIITTCNTKSEACMLEKLWIKNLNSLMPSGYNMTTGGDGGNTLESWTDEEKLELWKKQAESRKGMVHSEEAKAKMSKSSKGKRVPHRMREHISKIMKERGYSPPEATRWQKGQIGTMLGKAHTEESRRKISKARLGKTWDFLWDNEYVLKRKERIKMQFSGENNPRYVDMKLNDNLRILVYISNNFNFNIQDSKELLGFSTFKIRSLLRKVGISNFQSFKRENKLNWNNSVRNLIPYLFNEGEDVTEALGIIKYEKPIPAQLAGLIRGNFPSEIPKTDQERIQNLTKEFEGYKQFTWTVTEKLDGTSCTFYLDKNGDFHVCSRNLDLKRDENNTYWKMAIDLDIENKMKARKLFGLAIQGEIIGEGIQGNQYKCKQVFKPFDIYSVTDSKYLTIEEMLQLSAKLDVGTVPVLYKDYGLSAFDVESLLKFADGKSQLNDSIREGLVFQCQQDSSLSFKVVSNQWLLKYE